MQNKNESGYVKSILDLQERINNAKNFKETFPPAFQSFE